MSNKDDVGTRPATQRPGRRRKPDAPTTIYDIARVAGVNPSTVSRALSRPGRVSAKTEERIRATAKELNYRANPTARALLSGRTMTLGLLIVDVTHPSVLGIVRGVEQEATERGYMLLISESMASGDRELLAAERVLPSVDALVLGVSWMSAEQVRSLAGRKPMAAVNRVFEGVTSVLPDPGTGLGDAVRLLHAHGHRSIAYVSSAPATWMSDVRATVIEAAAERLGMHLQTVGPFLHTIEGGREAFAAIPPDATAVLAYNDMMAIGLMRAANERGVRLPDDLSLVGFDDIFGADFTTPSLTTIRSPLVEAGRRAVRSVLGEEPTDHPLQTELVVRASTGPVRSRHT